MTIVTSTYDSQASPLTVFANASELLQLLMRADLLKGCFPGALSVVSVEEQDPSCKTYKWTLETRNAGVTTLEPIYICRYREDNADSSVAFGSVMDATTTIQLDGKFFAKAVSGSDSQCHLYAVAESKVEIAVPSLMRGLANKMATKEMKSTWDLFLQNIKRHVEQTDALDQFSARNRQPNKEQSHGEGGEGSRRDGTGGSPMELNAEYANLLTRVHITTYQQDLYSFCAPFMEVSETRTAAMKRLEAVLATQADIKQGSCVLAILDGGFRTFLSSFKANVTYFSFFSHLFGTETNQASPLVAAKGNEEALWNFPFPDASFDAIVFVESISQLPSARQFFRECNRLLRANGRVAGTEWVLNQSHSGIDKSAVLDLCARLSIPEMRTISSVRQDMEAAGLVVHVSMDTSIDGGDVTANWAVYDEAVVAASRFIAKGTLDPTVEMMASAEVSTTILFRNRSLVLARFLALKPHL
eukprot:gnl/Hemi2/21624_TR7207_c0_g1_i1.p1 gnl/Hemi2/21624_TR7207_c0_g1~~gnl/Hemi2/21624_TR7207_c0_g1_i1.p1  ORF type:complete len:472 (-),score=50.42 gnl/Hemi2/21624_TR7207_c0_g1_i1:71-1486(-)